MTDYFYDREPDSGCCLNCSDAAEGCMCDNCKCGACEYHNIEGFCELARSFSITNKMKWMKKVSEMRDDGKVLLWCPECRQRRFVKRFENDEFADYYCFACGRYFTEDFIRSEMDGRMFGRR